MKRTTVLFCIALLAACSGNDHMESNNTTDVGTRDDLGNTANGPDMGEDHALANLGSG